MSYLASRPERNHDGKEWRYGTRGSLCIRIDQGTYFDNEAGTGGGTLDLIKNRGNLDKPGALDWLRHRSLIEAAGPKPRPKIVATYDYRDTAGAMAFQVVRFDPKDFRQRRPDGNGGWVWKMQGVQLVPFRLPELIEAIKQQRTVYIAEGEKGALSLVSIGLTATCSPGGAGKWKQVYTSHFAGADVVVLPDNDTPGRGHAAQVAAGLLPVARSVRVIALPDLPTKGDVFDWIAAGGTAEKLQDLAAGSAVLTAATEPRSAIGATAARTTKSRRLRGRISPARRSRRGDKQFGERTDRNAKRAGTERVLRARPDAARSDPN